MNNTRERSISGFFSIALADGRSSGRLAYSRFLGGDIGQGGFGDTHIAPSDRLEPNSVHRTDARVDASISWTTFVRRGARLDAERAPDPRELAAIGPAAWHPRLEQHARGVVGAASGATAENRTVAGRLARVADAIAAGAAVGRDEATVTDGWRTAHEGAKRRDHERARQRRRRRPRPKPNAQRDEHAVHARLAENEACAWQGHQGHNGPKASYAFDFKGARP